MIKSVLIDTSFLINLANEKFDYHDNAKNYLKTFVKREIDMYISSIVIAEFTAKQPLDAIPPDFLKGFKYLTFNVLDGKKSGELLEIKHLHDGSDRNRVKDDYKLMAQLINNSIDSLITGNKKDVEKIFKYCAKKQGLDAKFIYLGESPSVTLVEGNDLFSAQ